MDSHQKSDGSSFSSNSSSGSDGSDSGMVKINDTPNKNISLDQQTLSPPSTDSTDSYRLVEVTSGFERSGEYIHPHLKIIPDKITTAMKSLKFREPYFFVQFWSPNVDEKKHEIIMTTDQPFGLGVVEGPLCSYRKDSKHDRYIVDNDHEEGLNPPARVYRQGLPEWTSDVANYSPKHFPEQEHAIRCNVHGYLALPVFDLFTKTCVGVLEILTSSKFLSYADEIRQIQSELKKTFLTTTQASDCPTIIVNNEHRQKELEMISRILKPVCDLHRLPLAQTWAMSPLTTFASHEQILKKSCNSFHTRCLGKDCMSTNTLPFYVENSGLDSFRKACEDQHLDRSCSFVGKALLSRGSCFCDDITKLSLEEYPLAQYAHSRGLTSCLAIFLHSTQSKEDYVLEFFLPLHRENGRYEQELVQTLKHGIGIVSEFELGVSTQVVEPFVDLSSKKDSATIQTFSHMLDRIPQNTAIDFNMEELFLLFLNWLQAITNSTHVKNKLSPPKKFPNNGDSITDRKRKLGSLKIHGGKPIDEAAKSLGVTRTTLKRKLDSLTVEAVKKHGGKPIYEAAKSLGVSRSTLKRFCRDHNLDFWQKKHNTKTDDLNMSQRSQSKPDLTLKNKSKVDLKLPESNFVDASPKQIMASVVPDVRKVTVKVKVKDDMIMFRIPVSSGMRDLRDEVERRIKVKRFHVNYRDEEGDLIPVTSDAELHDLLRTSASNNTALYLYIPTDD